MKKFIFLLLMFQLPFILTAQNDGISFVHAKSWEEIKRQAKKEKKYIFVDAYTTWCGPCRTMSSEVFPLREVGQFFNKHFINVKAQLDTTAKDSREVKDFYQAAHDLQANYKIMAFPTFMFFNSDGQPVHRAVGSSSAEAFLEVARNAMDTSKQYYSLKQRYLEGQRDSAFLRGMVLAAELAYDRDFYEKVANEYLATQGNLFTHFNLDLLSRITRKTTDQGFIIFRKHANTVDAILGKDIRERLVEDVVLDDLVYPTMYPQKKIVENVDWRLLEKKLNKEFPDLSQELTLKAKARHFQRFKNWSDFSETVTTYVKLFHNKVSPDDLNSFAWAVFERCDDAACLQSALDWSKKSLEGPNVNNPMFMDTYANLLYKMGKKDEAIAMQEKAIENSGEFSNDLKETLYKMKKGEKTWE